MRNNRKFIKTFLISLPSIGLLIFACNSMAMSSYKRVPPEATVSLDAPEQKSSRAPFLFVINDTSKVSLEIMVPDRFLPLVREDKVVEALSKGLVEFKPESDLNANEWTELFTIIPLSGTGGVQAYTFRDSVLGELKDKTRSFATVNSAFKNEKGYQVATAIAQYQLNGRTEILYFYAISGPSTLVSIQYIKAVSPKEDLPKLINQLSALFAKNVKIIK